MSTYPVVVFGATGYTGRLVAARLKRSRIPFAVAGRDKEALRELVEELNVRAPVRVADVTDEQSLTGMLVKGTKVLVNCVGPFLDHGDAVVRAALRRKVHYLDTTGEQLFMKQMRDKYDREARSRKILMVNSMAFEYALGDFGAAMVGKELFPLDLLEVFYYIPSFKTSRGTKKSMIRAMANEIYGYEGGKQVQIRPGTFRKNVPLPGKQKPGSSLSFPGGEIVTVPQHLELKSLRTYMVMSITTARLMYAASPGLTRATRSGRLAGKMESAIDLEDFGPSTKERKQNKFMVALEGFQGSKGRGLRITGKDVYGLTAGIIAFGVGQILARKHKGPGVLAPAAAFNLSAFKRYTIRSGVKYVFYRAQPTHL